MRQAIRDCMAMLQQDQALVENQHAPQPARLHPRPIVFEEELYFDEKGEYAAMQQ